MDVAKPTKLSTWNSFYWLGVPLSILALLSSIFIWALLKQREQLNLQQQTKKAGQMMVSPIHNIIQDYIKSFDRIAKRWIMNNGSSKNDWYADANNYVKDMPAIHRISWVDKNMYVQWYVPDKESYTMRDLTKLPARYEILMKAKESHKPYVSKMLDLIQGPKGFIIIVPLFTAKGFDGYIQVGINIEKFFHQVFQNILSEDYGIAIYQDNAPVYSSNDAITNSLLITQEEINLDGIKWQLYVWPTKQFVDSYMTYIPLIILIAGILTAILILSVFYFLNLSEENRQKFAITQKEAELIAFRLNKILATVNEGYIAFTEQGIITDWNPYAVKILGWTKEEAIGANVNNLVIPERNRHSHRKVIEEFLASENYSLLNKEIEFSALSKDGSELTIEAVILPLKIDDDYTFHGFIRDISLRKKAEMDQDRLASIVNASADAIISADLSANILSYNPGAEKMYGYSVEEMLGRSILKLYTEENYGDLPKILEKIKAGEHVSLQTVRKHKDGHIIPVSVSIMPIRNKKGNVVGTCSITRDISELKRVEKIQNDFISIVSHELRTPLTSIRGSLSILASESYGILSEKAKKLVIIANNNCERLIRLINDILDVEKIEAGKINYHFENVDLGQLAEEVIIANEILTQKYNIKVKLIVKDQVIIRADKDKINQVITNLLSNAIRYSASNEEVQIIISAFEKKARVSIYNKGATIPEEFKNKIFGKFSQADTSASRKQGGTGLGLNISKAIVESHGGSIGFHSSEKDGTTFYFDIPIKQKKDLNADTVRKILVCVDKVSNGKYIKSLLENKNISADVAENITKAKKLLEENQYQAITVDFVAPKDKALEFIQIIRNHPKAKDTPIVVLSVHKTGENIVDGGGFPLVDWLSKPLDKDKSASIVQFIEKKYKRMPKILSVEDDNDIVKFLTLLLQEKASLTSVHTLRQARKALTSEEFDLVILDLILPDGNGADLLPCVNFKTKSPIPVIVFSIDELAQKYQHMVKESLLKSRVSNEDLFKAIESAINLWGPHNE